MAHEEGGHGHESSGHDGSLVQKITNQFGEVVWDGTLGMHKIATEPIKAKNWQPEVDKVSNEAGLGIASEVPPVVTGVVGVESESGGHGDSHGKSHSKGHSKGHQKAHGGGH